MPVGKIGSQEAIATAVGSVLGAVITWFTAGSEVAAWVLFLQLTVFHLYGKLGVVAKERDRGFSNACACLSDNSQQTIKRCGLFGCALSTPRGSSLQFKVIWKRRSAVAALILR